MVGGPSGDLGQNLFEDFTALGKMTRKRSARFADGTYRCAQKQELALPSAELCGSAARFFWAVFSASLRFADDVADGSEAARVFTTCRLPRSLLAAPRAGQRPWKADDERGTMAEDFR